VGGRQKAPWHEAEPGFSGFHGKLGSIIALCPNSYIVIR
jgi:hypothetical protein